jgi:AcrR family transcriptional regulator
VDAARELFGAEGFEHVGTERIVRKAGVTRGALYHHFKDKRGLFEAVFELVEDQATQAAANAAVGSGATDARAASVDGARAYLEFCLASDVRRILFVDSRVVISDARLREITEQYGVALIRAMFTAMIEGKQIRPLSVELLSALVAGMLIEGASFASESEDQGSAVDAVVELFELFLDGLAPD